jgi:hypothetical protein
MSIQDLSPLRDLVAPVTATPIQGSSSVAPSLPDASTAPAATATVSPRAELLSKLQHLQQSDPAAFARIATHMAETVDAEAQNSSAAQGKALTKLSGELKQAAKTGDLSVFKPTHHPHHTRTLQSAVTPSLLQNLLGQIDHVLGPGATPA